ncbi:hypothetical protein NQZ68_024391 [Dissostichus eleginoides]|nr:hypothetical protein NQZ68_024391 [Dissostichus eleginoides]
MPGSTGQRPKVHSNMIESLQKVERTPAVRLSQELSLLFSEDKGFCGHSKLSRQQRPGGDQIIAFLLGGLGKTLFKDPLSNLAVVLNIVLLPLETEVEFWWSESPAQLSDWRKGNPRITLGRADCALNLDGHGLIRLALTNLKQMGVSQVSRRKGEAAKSRKMPTADCRRLSVLSA